MGYRVGVNAHVIKTRWLAGLSAGVWLVLAVAAVLATLTGANLAVRRSAAPAAVAPPQSTFDPVSLVIGAVIEDAERAGQVQPALLSAALYATSTPTPSATPWPTRTPPPSLTLTPTPTETPSYVISEARLPVVEWERVSAFTAPPPRSWNRWPRCSSATISTRLRWWRPCC